MMQYFSIIARKGDAHPKTCAMLQAATLEAAAKQARHIIESDVLPHVDKNSRFSIRKSSRRETSLMQSFLASGTGDTMSTYLQEDLDGLLSRRNGMLLSFFMALYLDPKALKERFDPPSGQSSSFGGGNTGSGGIEAIATEEQTSSSENQSDVDSISSGSTDITEASTTEAPLSDDNQINALDNILNGGGEQGSDEIDLF